MNVFWTRDGKRRSYRLHVIVLVPALTLLALLACWPLLFDGSPQRDRPAGGGRSGHRNSPAPGPDAYGPFSGIQALSGRTSYGEGALEFEVKSAFSHIRVRKQGSVRSLLFVRDRGEEVVETALDLRNPHHLLVPYTQSMFASYLFSSKQERVLIVGLGGGAMIHFLKHHDPQLQVDVLEIDPVIVKIADEYFQTRSGKNVKIITADAFEYLKNTQRRYDVIYMDAFLKPSADTDSTGVPLRLKTIRFFQSIQEKLNPQGLVVFNLNIHGTTRNDLNTIRNAFPRVYVFRVPHSENLVVVASLVKAKAKASALKLRAAELDRSFQADFSFQEMLKKMVR